jgi:hypothetical protein
MCSSTQSLTLALVGGEWSASRTGRFNPKEIALYNHLTGGWVGLRAVLDAVMKRKIRYSRNTPLFVKSEGSFTYLKEPATGVYYEYTNSVALCNSS